MKFNGRIALFYRFCLYLCFFFSGSSALMYQIVWTRKCMLLLGSTAYAVSTVLSIFFLGLGMGSFIGGRIAERSSNPMRWYAIVELFIGLWAWVVVEIITNHGGVLSSLINSMPASVDVFFAVRIAVALFWFTLPAMGMGMTFPLLSKYDKMSGKPSEHHISSLYLINTLGAMLGAVVAGFILIPKIGYLYTNIIAVVINLIVGVFAWVISNLSPSFLDENIIYSPIEIQEENNHSYKVTILLFLGVFISGWVCLTLEVLWTRLLIMIFLGTNYAYTSVLVSVLAGIAIGAIFTSVSIKKIHKGIGVVGMGYGITGASVIFTLFLISQLPKWMEQFNLETTPDFYYGIIGKFLLAFVSLILPLIGFGFTFPLALTLIRQLEVQTYSKIGFAYGLNTIGGIIGSVMGGFIVIPYLGCERGIFYSGLILAILGFAFALCEKKYRVANLSIITLLFVISYSFYPSSLMEKINRFYLPEKHKILFFKEGVEGTVAVSSPPIASPNDERVLWINRVQATTAVERGVRMNRFQGIIPHMFNRQPQHVLFMCFGSGITCGTLGIGGFQTIDAVEISPEVLEASRLFSDKNFNVVDMSNLKIYIDDARNFLIRTHKKYDFITTEPMPLALAGVSMFYTREFYQFCLQHLNTGGMVSQWVPFHSSSEYIVQSVVFTFLDTFPYCAGLFVNADLFLVGSNQPLFLNPKGLEHVLEQNPVLKEAMVQAGFPDVEEIIACFVMDRDSLIHFSKGGKYITDTFPWVEFDAPQFVYNRQSVPKNLNRMKEYFSNVENNLLTKELPEEIRLSIINRQNSHRKDLDGLILYYDGFLIGEQVRKSFIESLRIDKNNKQAQYYLRTISITQIEQYIRWEETTKAREIVNEVLPYLEEDVSWREWLQKTKL